MQDDRTIVAANPAAHDIPAAIRAFDDPYWPKPSRAGLYRPIPILTYAMDWTVSGGKASWFHLMNSAWHALACVLLVLVLARWLPPVAALAGGLMFAVHPVHVEGVASLVSRAEILVAVGLFGAVLSARRGWWTLTVLLAAFAMFSKEHGVIVGPLLLADDLLGRRESRTRYPLALYASLAGVTIAYLLIWRFVGRDAVADPAAAFNGTGLASRLAIALPAVLRAALLLVWPLDLSVDYGPQVIPARMTFSPVALGGVITMVTVLALLWWSWRRRQAAPFFAVLVAVLAYLPTSNLLFPSGVVLSERNLYLPVVAVAALAGIAVARLSRDRGPKAAVTVLTLALLPLSYRTLDRLPTWSSNRSLVLTTLTEHPESYRAHVWAASVLSGLGDTAGVRREYARAESLFNRDPHLDAAHAYFLMTLDDTAAARPRIERARDADPRDPFGLRARYLYLVRRGDREGAKALADTANSWNRIDEGFYRLH